MRVTLPLEKYVVFCHNFVFKVSYLKYNKDIIKYSIARRVCNYIIKGLLVDAFEKITTELMDPN